MISKTLLKDTLFKDYSRDYTHCLELITNAIERIRAQIDLINKTMATYTDIIFLLSSTSKQIDFIVLELNSTTIWYRPQYAISWEGLMRIIPDVERFASDLTSYFSQVKPVVLLNAFKNSIKNPLSLFISFLLLLVMILLLLLAKIMLPSALHRIQVAAQTRAYVYTLYMFLVALGRFLLIHFNGIAVWLVMYGSFKLQIIDNPYLYSLFYLISIPYLLYLAHQFISYFASFNQEHGYLFLSKDFEFRFTLMFSALLYVTIILYFFKEAFMLGNYRRSELPSVLVALNFIFIQVVLIALIPKNQIVNLIPTHDIWGWIHEQINRYYYLVILCIVTIIVMSNPYVGFGRLVAYVIWRILYTIIVVIILLWLHRLIKRFCAYFFFVEEDDVQRERFAHAKSWYGFAVNFTLFILYFPGTHYIGKSMGMAGAAGKNISHSRHCSRIATPFHQCRSKTCLCLDHFAPYFLYFRPPGRFICL